MKHKRIVKADVTVYVDDDEHCSYVCDYLRHGLCTLYRSKAGFRKLRFDGDGRELRYSQCLRDELKP